MTLLALLLISFGLTDIAWSAAGAARRPGMGNVWEPAVGLSAAVGTAGSLGVSGSSLALIAVGLTLATGFWWYLGKADTPARSWLLLAFIGTCSLLALVAGGFVAIPGGWAGDWYGGWDWSLTGSASLQQAILLVAALLFSVASANRVVSATLWIAGTPPQRGEVRLKGGRVLGPMERWIVMAMILGGQPAGVAIVFAAKGLLRFPTLSSGSELPAEGGADSAWSSAEYSEYFLVGTFASLIVAAVLAVVVLAVS